DTPMDLAFGPGGDLYVADRGNGVVRRIVAPIAAEPAPARLEVVSGDGQSAMLADRLAAPIVFRAHDGQGNPLVGASPFFSGSPDVAVVASIATDAQGQSLANV